MANDQDTFHADLCELLTILGMGDHSRPQSPHEVFQEALGVLRERLSLPAPTAPSPCLGEREAVARTLTRAQFIVAIAVEIGIVGQMPAAKALPLASSAYQEFERDNRIKFGDPAYAWDESAARIIAREYEIDHWEAA